VAQLVERNLAKVEVAGSIPVIRSRSSRSTPGASLVSGLVILLGDEVIAFECVCLQVLARVSLLVS
jgi:hypothetical protein